VVHESVWTATARRADIVLPATVTLERDDIAASANDPFLVAMHAAAAPCGEAKDDYGIFSLLARELGVEARFTEGHSAHEWLRHLYEATRLAAAGRDCAMPPFAEFWERGEAALPLAGADGDPVRAFRADPEGHPLPTPTGRVELHSNTIAGFGYPDCPGHPAWLEPEEWQGSRLAARYPLMLVANQPARRLHSQLDFGAHSVAGKLNGRERVRIHPDDARVRGIRTDDVVRLFNARGSCLAAAEVGDDIVAGVVQLPTGAWYTPADVGGRVTCLYGNPNILTFDRGTSRLAQGSCGQHALVQVERFDGSLPGLAPHDPPAIER
jgi:biotin/methionine sulfoxide reductase